ncbi:MAG: LEA type 2 family protein [Bacteroidetes bacterium]|nr:LEA type 2 family protein [Bacteroidota bacterium]
MRKLISILGLLLVVSSVFQACGKEPRFIGIQHAKIIGIKDSLLLFDLDYIAFNPNRVSAKLKSSTIDVYFRKQWVGTGTIQETVALPANDTVALPVKCTVSLNKLHAFYSELIAADSAVFELRGHNKIGISLLSINNKVAQEIHLNTKSYFEDEVRRSLNANRVFSVQNFSMSRFPGLNESEFEMKILIKNTLPIDYVLEDMSLGFFADSGGENLATWQLQTPLFQKALTETSLPVSVKVNHFNLLKSSKLSWLTSQSAKFKLVGKMKVNISGKSFDIPIDDFVTFGM